MEFTAQVNLEDIIANYQQTDLSYHYIPDSIMNHIHKKFYLPADARVIAFLSCFPKKSGVCFTNKGVYWRLLDRGKGYFSWEQLNNTASLKLKDGVLLPR